ncbi:phosphatidylinositol 4-kinase gamma 8-like [Amaranthus tricolor]|uniref:phosphatidylinositol 4-kinase gamma 8-like n=1 Tax=Amaranthus tricolor TaxID=29722 RepID=UPI002585AB07|nr:phosphatidylinositol 4-kinase gamma 8-like [Amaranthus tricolor]
MALVIDQHPRFKPPARSQRCRLLTFTHLDFFAREKSSNDVFHSIGQAELTTNTSFHRSISTPCLTLTKKAEEDFDESRKVELIGGKGAFKVRALVVEVAIALASGVHPMPICNGLGGAYLLNNRNGEAIAVAKPIDEEPLALNNPKGFTGRMLGQPGLRRSIRVGDTGIRELAAYILDHDGFAGVSPTALVKFSNVNFHVNNSSPTSCSRYKIASLQRFVEHDSDAGDLSPSGFSVSSVHRIGIFDIRVLNIDRHSGNILVGKYERDKHSLGAAKLIPIDHGLCLPEWLDDPYFEWLHWPQSSIPFSDDEMNYISKLNPFEDAKLLRTQIPSLGEASIRVFVICTIFLKRAASVGLCLGEIGEMMTRDCLGGEETMSVLETICARAKVAVASALTFNIHYGDTQTEDEKEFPLFQFDEECEHDNMLNQPNTTCLSKTPHCKMEVKNLRPMAICVNHDVVQETTKANSIKASENRKGANLVKSISFATPGRMNDIEGISFGEMEEREWDFFLEAFDMLLPEVFEERKNFSITQRVGSA